MFTQMREVNQITNGSTVRHPIPKKSGKKANIPASKFLIIGSIIFPWIAIIFAENMIIIKTRADNFTFVDFFICTILTIDFYINYFVNKVFKD